MSNHFENAKRIQQSYRSATDAIRRDATLSDQGKKMKLAQAYRDARTRMDALKQQYAADLDKQHQELRKSAFALGFPIGATEADKEAAHMSYRDALGRVSSIDSQQAALKALDDANLVGDKLMVEAIAKTAYDKGWSHVLDGYSNIRPGKAQAMRDLTRFEEDQTDPNARFGMGMMFSLQSPPEVLPSDINSAPPTEQTAAG